MIKAIIFDCFGVLAGSGFNETYHQAGGDVVADNDFVRQTLRDASRGVITTSELNKKVAERIGISQEQWQQTVLNAEQPNAPLLAHISELKKHYKMAILSNASIGVMQRKFTPEQLSLFDAVVVSAEVGLMKPDPAIYKLTAERMGVDVTECVFTDDSPAYCEAAEAIGMKAIVYDNFEQFKSDLDTVLNHK